MYIWHFGVRLQVLYIYLDKYIWINTHIREYINMWCHTQTHRHTDMHIIWLYQDLYLASISRTQKTSGLKDCVSFLTLRKLNFRKNRTNLTLPAHATSWTQDFLVTGKWLAVVAATMSALKTGKSKQKKWGKRGHTYWIIAHYKALEFIVVFYWQELDLMTTSLCKATWRVVLFLIFNQKQIQFLLLIKKEIKNQQQQTKCWA